MHNGNVEAAAQSEQYAVFFAGTSLRGAGAARSHKTLPDTATTQKAPARPGSDPGTNNPARGGRPRASGGLLAQPCKWTTWPHGKAL